MASCLAYSGAVTVRPMTNQKAHRTFPPTPIIFIHVLAFIGVGFWISMIISALTIGGDDVWAVVLAGLILGGAHVAISVFTSKHSTKAYVAMWFVFISDSALALFVNPQAVVLILFTVVLLGLTRFPSSKIWFSSQL